MNGLGGETDVVLSAASGQVKNTNGVFNRYYYLKEHLDKIRVTVNATSIGVGDDDYSFEY